MATPFTYSTVGFSGFSGYAGTSLYTAVYNNSFSPGQVIYRTSGGYALAQANSAATSDAIGVVQSANATSFTAVINGVVTGLSGLTDSYQYYLSDTVPGLLTTTVPTAVGSVIKPMLIATGAASGIVVEFAGAVIGSSTGTSGYHAKWTSGSSLGNSLVQETSSTVTINGNLSATGSVNGSGFTGKSMIYTMVFGT